MKFSIHGLFAKKRTTGFGRFNVCVFSFVVSSCFLFFGQCVAAVIPSEEVWKKAQEVGRKNDIDPLLIYSIACAESSLDDHADSGHARGIMQMSHLAWSEVSKRSYNDAWKWQINMEVAAKYLHYLRGRLENSGRYSWPMLAAAYHYGPRRVAEARYRITRLPTARNKIYKSLFAGRIPELPGSVPYRSIDAPASIQAFAKAEPKTPLVLPILNEAFYNEIPEVAPDALVLVPLTPFQQDAKILEPEEKGEAGESHMLKPVVFGSPDFVAPLAKVPDLGSLFVIKYLKVVNEKLAASSDFPEKKARLIDKSALVGEKPPEVTVVEPAELDTTINGILKTHDDNPLQFDLPALDPTPVAAPEE